MSEIRIRAQYEPWQDSLAIYLFDGDALGRNVTFERRTEGEFANPTLRISHHAAQVLIDELWQCGLRPTQGKQSEGVTAAQARHLNDMRAIVGHKLGIAALGDG